MLEGPHGPVSHLICGGVYDWSTGLIYQGGRYFDPALGIWLALLPLAVVQGGRKRKSRRQWALLLGVALLAGGTLAGCERPQTPAAIPQYCINFPLNTPKIQSFTATLGTVDTMGWAARGEASLHLGHPPGSGKPYGIAFKAAVLVPENAIGHLEFVQIGATHRVYEEKDQCCYMTTMGSWRLDDREGFLGVYPMLDERFSYDNYHESGREKYTYVSSRPVSSAGLVHLETGDAPAVTFPPPMGYPGTISNVKKIRAEDRFETYLVWRAEGSEEREVLGMISWGWKGEARVLADGTLGPAARQQAWQQASVCPENGDIRHTSPGRLGQTAFNCTSCGISPDW